MYRLFLRLHGREQAAPELAGFISRTEVQYNALLAALPPPLAQQYKARCKEAVRDGGGGGRGGAEENEGEGMWTIPAPIMDEDAFRANCAL